MRDKEDEVKNKIRRVPSMPVKLQAISLCLVLIAGCFSFSKPPHLVQQYTLEYSAPAIEGLHRLDESITIDRFSVAQSFNSAAMVYRAAPHQLSSYIYHRWRVNPGDMVTDFLLRDLRNAGILRAAFSYRDSVRARFLLEGRVEQFLQIVVKGGAKIVLHVTASLIDNKESEMAGRVVFQKDYSSVDILKENTPDGYARGMSVLMSRFSGEVTKDIYEALKDRI
jgi:ABC-type uncharacterized transport system auxiliary subunit